jgi:hypothetical protein
MRAEKGATGWQAGRSENDGRRTDGSIGGQRGREAALSYRKRGWRVLPLWWLTGDCACPRTSKTRDEYGRCHSAGKHPITKHGVNDATTDEAVIRQWWTEYPQANVAIATGSASGLLVIDVDPRNGGNVTLEELVSRLGELPETIVVETGGGGQHYYFAAPDGDVVGALGDGVDVKFNGGYVVAPPSVHVSGGTYTFRAECAPDEVSL